MAKKSFDTHVLFGYTNGRCSVRSVQSPLTKRARRIAAAYPLFGSKRGDFMVTDWVRRWSGSILIPIARFVSWTGISPNGITLMGFLLTVAVAYLLAVGYFPLAGALLIVAAFFDGIDGA